MENRAAKRGLLFYPRIYRKIVTQSIKSKMHYRADFYISTIGMLALGSEDAQRFYAEMGILYLERMGEMVSAALTRVAKPAQ